VTADVVPAVRRAVARRFAVDPRALAAFRVGLGSLLLVDLLLRTRSLVAFYTDSGAVPRSALWEHSPVYYRVSLHTLSGAAWFQALAFAVAGGFALAMVVGYRTRVATVASFVLLVSLQARNPLVLNGGDTLLTSLLLWAAFLPLGKRWSVDALGETEHQDRIASLATAALLCQVVVVYTANGLFKLRGDLWVEGTAIRYVFSLDRFTWLLADVLADHPALLVALDRVWFAMVLSSVLLVVVTGWPRAALVSLFACAHLGMLLTLRLGLFPLVSVVALIPFLQSAVWDRAMSSVGQRLGPMVDHLSARVSGADGGGTRVAPGREIPISISIPDRARTWWNRTTSGVVAVLLATMLVWNAATLGYVPLPGVATGAVDPAEHGWDMFAPEPLLADGWYVVPGRLDSGRSVDALHRRDVRWDRPPDVTDTYPTVRWQKFLFNLRDRRYAGYREALAGYLCRHWNAERTTDLVGVTLYYVEQPTRLDGPEPTRRVKLGEYACG
jgi:hypothetical protein